MNAQAPWGRTPRGSVPPPRVIDHLSAALLLIYVWRIQDVISPLSAVRAPVIVSLLALAVWVSGGYASGLTGLLRHPVVRTVLFIAGWSALSVVTSVYPGHSFRFLVNDHFKTVLAAAVILSSIRGLHDLERLAWWHLLGATIYSVKVLLTFEVSESGRLGSLYFYDANDLAMMLVCTLPLCVYFAARPGRPMLRLVAGVALPVFLLTIVRTGSRGGFLGLLGVALFVLLFFRAIKPRVRLGVTVVGATILLTVAGPRYWEMMSSLLNPTADYNWAANNEAGRGAVWLRGLEYMAQHPILGVGVQAFPMAEGMLSDLAARQQVGIGLKWSTAHSSYIQIGAELGLPGLIALLALLYHLFRVLRARARLRSGSEWNAHATLAEAFLASLLGYAVCGAFLSQAYSAYLHVFSAMVVGMDVAGSRNGTGVHPIAQSRGRRHTPPLSRGIMPASVRRNGLEA